MMHAAQQPLAARAVHLWAAVPLPAALGWHSKAPRKAQSMAAHQIPTVCSYSIRAIASSDIPRLAEIEQQCKEFSACWSGADIAAELDNSLSRAAVAADDSTDEALGYIVCWLVAGELQVLECAVHPAHQSQGIGTALLQHMLQTHSHPQGAVLEVKAHNQRAIRLYERLGFVEVGRRPNFYACRADALLMARQQPGI